MVAAKNKVIFSTGIGKLHFFESALALHKLGCPLEIITGWHPKDGNPWVNLTGKLIGQKNLSKRLAARRPAGLESVLVNACGWSEAYAHALGILSKGGFLNPSRANAIGFQTFGNTSRQYLHDAAILHVRSGAGQGGAITTARSQGMKIVVDHSIAHPISMENLLKEEYERFNLSLPFHHENELWQLVLRDCAEADILLVNSNYVQETFIQEGYPAEQVCVVYLGVRPDFWGLKKEYQLGKEIRLLFTGHFDLRKGARILLEALTLLQKQDIPCRLDVVGFVALDRSILDQYANLTQIYFHGFVPQNELKIFFSTADLFVFPTFAEGSSRSAMEAMAAGLPVITTQNCGIPIEHGINGWYVPVGDSKSLCEAVISLGNDEEKRAKLGINAFHTITQQYKWEDYAIAMMQLYQRITT